MDDWSGLTLLMMAFAALSELDMALATAAGDGC